MDNRTEGLEMAKEIVKKQMAIPVIFVTLSIALLGVGWAIGDRGRAEGAAEATLTTQVGFLTTKDVLQDEQLNHLDEAIHSIETDMALLSAEQAKISVSIASMAESLKRGEP